jgi:hypothetical protein
MTKKGLGETQRIIINQLCTILAKPYAILWRFPLFLGEIAVKAWPTRRSSSDVRGNTDTQ